MDSRHDVQFGSPRPTGEARAPLPQELSLWETLHDGSAAEQDRADADPAPIRGCLYALPISLALWGAIAWTVFRG